MAAPSPPRPSEPRPGRPRWWRAAGATHALALAGAGLAAWAGVPLPWMLGPFFVCAAAAMAGLPLMPLPMARQAAQLTIGLGIGLRFTAATLAATLALVPAMLAATAYVIAYTMAAASLFRPLGGVDRPTAFFATAAGGLADMALVARERGGDPGAVGIVHALRVSATVAVVPLLVVGFGAPGTAAAPPEPEGLALLWLVPALAGAVVTAALLARTPMPNPWLVGAMLLGLLLGAGGLLATAVPTPMILAAQLLLGAHLGSQFRRELLLALPRVALAGVAAALFMIACAFGGALVLSALTALPLATAFLALAPAAVTEMVITAKAMRLDPEIVTAFHVLRIVVVCATVTLAYRIHGRLAGPS